MPQDNISKFKRLAHVVYDCRYHIVFVTKYRFKIIDKNIEIALKWAIKDVCDWKEVEILAGSVQEEHVRLYLRVPPKYSISEVMKWIKGKSATNLFKKFPSLEKQYWGRHLWSRGYFVSTVGITDDIIRKYIQKQHNDEISNFSKKWES